MNFHQLITVVLAWFAAHPITSSIIWVLAVFLLVGIGIYLATGSFGSLFKGAFHGSHAESNGASTWASKREGSEHALGAQQHISEVFGKRFHHLLLRGCFGAEYHLKKLMQRQVFLRSYQRRLEHEMRKARCLSDLPLLIDIVSLGLSAGLSFDASLELYCDRSEGLLSEELQKGLLSWRLGVKSRQTVLEELALAFDSQALMRFASVVSEALRFGTPLSAALERQASVIRSEQRAQFEEAIEKVPVKMLIPLGTLIVPALFLAILGPLLGTALFSG